jgi:hypothetical protein
MAPNSCDHTGVTVWPAPLGVLSTWWRGAPRVSPSQSGDLGDSALGSFSMPLIAASTFSA